MGVVFGHSLRLLALLLSICRLGEDDLDRLAIDRVADEQLPFAQACNCRANVLIQEAVVWRVDLGGASAPDDLGSTVARYPRMHRTHELLR